MDKDIVSKFLSRFKKTSPRLRNNLMQSKVELEELGSKIKRLQILKDSEITKKNEIHEIISKFEVKKKSKSYLNNAYRFSTSCLGEAYEKTSKVLKINDEINDIEVGYKKQSEEARLSSFRFDKLSMKNSKYIKVVNYIKESGNE